MGTRFGESVSGRCLPPIFAISSHPADLTVGHGGPSGEFFREFRQLVAVLNQESELTLSFRAGALHAFTSFKSRVTISCLMPWNMPAQDPLQLRPLFLRLRSATIVRRLVGVIAASLYQP